MPRFMKIVKQEKMNKEFSFLNSTHFPIFSSHFSSHLSSVFPTFPLVLNLFTAIVFTEFTHKKGELVKLKPAQAFHRSRKT